MIQVLRRSRPSRGPVAISGSASTNARRSLPHFLAAFSPSRCPRWPRPEITRLIRAARELRTRSDGAVRRGTSTYATLPQVLTGFRIALGVAGWSWSPAEMIASIRLGYIIIDARQCGAATIGVVGMMLIGLIGIGSN